MEDRIYQWGNNRRFNSYAGYFKSKFGKRVQKVAIDAGFTCPNRDGTAGRGGCTYCNNKSFNPSYCAPSKSVSIQINEGIAFHAHRYKRASQYMAYFQAYSNTYASVDRLKELYCQALEHPDVIGLVIGTRPDCIDEEKLDLIEEISRSKYVAVEYGIESCYNKTLERINRCHNFECTLNAVEQTAARGINTGAHIMFGLPGETLEEMVAEIDIISKMPLTSVKFHQLQILKNTAMEQDYLQNKADFHEFSVDEYLNFMCSVVERLNPAIAVERIAGEVPPDFLAVKPWCSLRNDKLLELFEQQLKAKDTWQGRFAKQL